MKTNYKNINADKLRELMAGITISANKQITRKSAVAIFAEYVSRAMPNYGFTDIIMNNTDAALNSVSAFAVVKLKDKIVNVFLKVHIEVSKSTNFVPEIGRSIEYKNNKLLQNSGWPSVVPIAESVDDRYPMVVYVAFSKDDKVLFDEIKNCFDTSDTTTLDSMLPLLKIFQGEIGKAQLRSFKIDESNKPSKNAPVQMFFGQRLEPGARADQWFNDFAIFDLPGLQSPISWKDLRSKKWIINGEEYEITLENILNNAKSELAYDDVNSCKSLLIMAHGDDHPGNIIVNTMARSTKCFDPVAAGYAPIGLANAKALAHVSILPMAGMYYDPKCPSVNYMLIEDKISVEYDFCATSAYEQLQIIASQIIEERIIPTFQRARDNNFDFAKEIKSLKSALAMCAILTIDTSMLLSNRSGLGQGLLPAAIMLSQLRGLPFLNKLNDELEMMLKENI